MPTPTPELTLKEARERLKVSPADVESAYTDGIEDLADKVIELIYQSDYTVTLQEIIDFCEAEKAGAP